MKSTARPAAGTPSGISLSIGWPTNIWNFTAGWFPDCAGRQDRPISKDNRGASMTAEAIARKWHDRLFSAEPVDHGRAEAAVRDAYRAAGLAEPERFLWCASPLEAVWAALVLVGKTESYNHAVYEDVERSKSGKQKLPEVRASVAQRLEISEGQVEGYFGRPFYRAEGTNPVTKRLQENFDAWMARAEAGDDFLAVHRQGPFRPLHDLEQALHFEGERRGAGSLYKEALAKAGNKHVAILGGRSAQHRLYGNFAYAEVAVDEALAAAGKFQPTELQRALWAAYESCGLWWPCEAGVVFAERPTAAELTADGPHMEWPDGFTVGGKPAVKAAPSRPEPAPAVAMSRESVLAADLPTDHDERIAWLRGQSSALPHLDRYLAGEHEFVWKDLLALGGKALSDDHAADALAVAYETMDRVERNVRTIAERLVTLGYRFVYPGSGGLLGLLKPKAHLPHLPPPADVRATIAELEAAAGGPVPLSLRAFFEVVGTVNFNGDHPSLAPMDCDFLPDPLMVCGADDALAMLDSFDRDEDDPLLFEFAPDALHKANISGGAPYSIELPRPAADVRVEDAPHDVAFVEYLRIALLGWGGFPGWEEAGPAVPAELNQLRRDLVPF
jgi:hypothetical protein